MSALLYDVVDGDIYDGAAHNASQDQIEASFDVLGPYVISGLAVSAGTGLSVNVALGVAFIGGYVNKAAGFTISGLTPSTTNHLYLLQAGTGTANTTGTAPSDSVKLGTALTDGSGVLSVAQTWASGRQTRRRTEDLVHGSGAGHPRALDLSQWHLTNNEGNEVKGQLPAGALATGAGTFTQTTKTANYTATTSDFYIWVDATGGAVTITLPTAIGNAGRTFVIKKIDSSGNAVTIDANGSQTIDGALTQVITTQYAAYSIASDNANWFIW